MKVARYEVPGWRKKRGPVPEGRNERSPVRSAGTEQETGPVPKGRSNGRGLALQAVHKQRGNRSSLPGRIV
jgi:hypothetical protein